MTDLAPVDTAVTGQTDMQRLVYKLKSASATIRFASDGSSLTNASSLGLKGFCSGCFHSGLLTD